MLSILLATALVAAPPPAPRPPVGPAAQATAISILQMADVLSEGISKQVPARFN